MKKINILLLILSNLMYAQTPNWSNNVAKIVYENCTSCHRTGGIAPFRLTTYQDVVNNAASISAAVSSGIMPPWTPDPNYKSFVHQRVISQSDKNTILQWINNNTPSGNLHFAPPAPIYSSNSQLISPNVSLSIPTYTVVTNEDEYHNFVIPSGLTQINFAKEIEIIPGNPSIVHHVLVFEDNSTNPISPTSIGGTGSPASNLLFGYTPGAQPYFTPVGTGLKLNANTRIILQIHYAPGSQGQTDNTTINFKTTTSTQRQIYVLPLLNHSSSITNGPLYIPANQTHTFNEQYTVPINATLLYAFPHMHLIGKSIESYGITPSGETIPFVKIPDWKFHWQDNFVFPNAVKINSGTILKAESFYDNTTNNPENPNNPPLDVSLGEGTHDEMMLVFFAFMPYQLGDENLIIDKRIIATGSTTFCEGQSLKLKTIEGIGYSYQWLKNGIIIPNEINSTYIASTSGNYTVSITLGPNIAVSDPTEIIVQSSPIATINPAGLVSIPTSQSLNLNANTGVNYTYQWYKDGILINNANSPLFSTSTPGNYYVEVYNGCYAVSAITTLTASLKNNEFDSFNDEIVLFPNPNDGMFYIKNAENTQLNLYNELGQLIYSETIKNNKFQITIPNKGIYLAKILTSNGEVINKKVSIK
jgi:Secretion system C-terminal sorting domain